jgi:hypothetical protein
VRRTFFPVPPPRHLGGYGWGLLLAESSQTCCDRCMLKGWKLWTVLPPILWIVVGAGYSYFNEHYVVKWWVHCKHCTVGPTPSFDANDFTMIFFGSFWVLTSVSLFFILGKSQWRALLVTVFLDAFIAAFFMSANIWA